MRNSAIPCNPIIEGDEIINHCYLDYLYLYAMISLLCDLSISLNLGKNSSDTKAGSYYPPKNSHTPVYIGTSSRQKERFLHFQCLNMLIKVDAKGSTFRHCNKFSGKKLSAWRLIHFSHTTKC